MTRQGLAKGFLAYYNAIIALPTIMKRFIHLFFIFSLFVLFASLTPKTFAAAMTYGSGVYTNLCGSGTGSGATADSCNRGCNPGAGTCTSNQPFVAKWTCDGNVTQCNSNESAWSTSQSVAGTACGKTVGLAVYSKNCRDNGWSCTNNDMKDFMVWYSGDCNSGNASNTGNASNADIAACDGNQLNMSVSPNPAPLSGSVTFSSSGSQGSTWVGDSWSRGVSCNTNGFWGSTTCSANTPGTFTWTHTWRNCSGNVNNCSSTTCTKQANFTVGGSNHTSSCTGLSIASGNNSMIPATVKLHVNGTDSAGAIQNYRFFFGDGSQADSTTPDATHQYQIDGAFTATAYIQDSTGAWVSSNQCQTTVNTHSLPFDAQKSDCANLFITQGNYTAAPATVSAQVTGFDNKGVIKKYKVDFDNGTTLEDTSNTFTHTYNQAGTYTLKGFIMDSAGNWKGGQNSCIQTLYITTKTLTKQPSTGTPTIYTIIGLGSGMIGFMLVANQFKINRIRKAKKSRKRRS